MKQLFVAFISIVGLVVGALLWIRFASRKRHLPCPPWLTCCLENPYFDALVNARIVLDRAGVGEGMRILDVGCGPGRITLPAAERVGSTGEVAALDIQEEMLERLRERIAKTGKTNISIIHAGAGEGKMAKNAFDRVLLVAVLGEIVNREAAIAEIFSALGPGGLLSVTEALPDPHYQTRSTVERLATDAGFLMDSQFGNLIAFTMNFRKPGGEMRYP